MTVKFGSETTTLDMVIGDELIREELVEAKKDYTVHHSHKRYTVRVKVRSQQDETTQYLIWSDLIQAKKLDAKLWVSVSDPTTLPSFVIDCSKKDTEGYYYIIRSHTEIVI